MSGAGAAGAGGAAEAADAPEARVAELLAVLSEGDAARAAASLHAAATARFRGRVGGEGDLARLLANDLHAPLLGHRAARLDPLERIEDAARQRVTVTGADGAHAAFLISLTRRDGAWLVSGLVREEVALL